MLVAIDDDQWLDPSSKAALQFALRRLREEPVALLLARRPDGPSGVEQALPPERLLRVPVGPLEFVALNAVLHERLDSILSRPLLRRIHELSAGNPFYALELAQSPGLLEAGTLPPTLDSIVRGRLAALPEQAQLALLVVAAASQPSAKLVEQVLGDPDALAPAEAEGIVELDHGDVSFTHPLLASGAYTAADPARRREVHRRLGRIVRDPEERARHLAAAATGPDPKVANALRARRRTCARPWRTRGRRRPERGGGAAHAAGSWSRPETQARRRRLLPLRVWRQPAGARPARGRRGRAPGGARASGPSRPGGARALLLRRPERGHRPLPAGGFGGRRRARCCWPGRTRAPRRCSSGSGRGSTRRSSTHDVPPSWRGSAATTLCWRWP